MFGTVIIDAYTKDETEALAYAIDDICCLAIITDGLQQESTVFGIIILMKSCTLG